MEEGRTGDGLDSDQLRPMNMDQHWEAQHVMVHEEQDKNQTVKAKAKKDPHKTCRSAGVPTCKQNSDGLLLAIKKRLTDALRMICRSENKYREQLLDGHLCFGFQSRACQTQLEIPKAAATSSASSFVSSILHQGIENEKRLWFHVSLVIGALQQFFPILAAMHPRDKVENNVRNEWPDS